MRRRGKQLGEEGKNIPSFLLFSLSSKMRRKGSVDSQLCSNEAPNRTILQQEGITRRNCDSKLIKRTARLKSKPTKEQEVKKETKQEGGGGEAGRVVVVKEG